MNTIETWLTNVPVIAIIRGVRPEEVVDIGMAIYQAGVGIIEVPLNSPRPFDSIEKLSHVLGEQCIIGCGTLLTTDDAQRVADAGGKIAVTPNTNPAIIQRCIDLNMEPIPGWGTLTEAFTAYQAGAKYLKLFPASTYGSTHISAAKAVLPTDAKILTVGGVGAHNATEWLAAGANGFAIGREIYQAGHSAAQVHQRTTEIVKSIAQSREQMQCN